MKYLFLEVIFFVFLIGFYAFHTLILYDPSKLYSTSIAHLLQVNALLQGRLSLSPQPFGLPHDFIWGIHGIQQAWGFGVPLLELPFEWIAQKCGFYPFPDRLILLFYLILMIAVINIALKLALKTLEITAHSLMGTLMRFYLVAWILFNPTMSHPELDVYGQTILYGCIYGYILLSLLLIYVLRPTSQLFFGLCLASGLAWLIRPTLLAFGVVTFGLVAARAYQNRCGIRLMISGILGFCLGIALQLGLNYYCFGSILEFGYSGQYSKFLSVYCYRFGFPFQHEHFGGAFKELMGALFFNNLWATPTVRYRGPTIFHFNVSHLMVIGIGFLSLFSIMFSRLLRESLKNVILLLSFGTISFLLLFIFYLRFPFLCTTYWADFTVSYSAVLIALIMMGYAFITSYSNKKYLSLLFIFAGIFFCLNNKLFFNHDPHQYDLATDKKGVQQIIHRFNRDILYRYDLPQTFYCGSHYYFSRLYHQFEGWKKNQDCSVFPSTLFFLPSNRCLSLNYSILKDQKVPPVQLKRDFTFMKLTDTNVLKDNSGALRITQRFCSDVSISNRPSLYVIGWVEPDQLNWYSLPITLNWVSVADKQ